MNILEVKPSSGEQAKKLVVFLHGLGSNGQDLLGLVPYFAPAFPDFHFYSPNGIEPCDMGSYGYQWFSLQNRDPHILAKEIEKSSVPAFEMIKSKLAELNLTVADLVIIGFSQGTMLGLYLVHAFDAKIAAMIGFAGMFFPPSSIKNTKTPICLIHGIEDDVVSFECLENSRAALEKLGVKVIETHAIQNLRHSIDLKGLKYATDFLLKYLK